MHVPLVCRERVNSGVLVQGVVKFTRVKADKRQTAGRPHHILVLHSIATCPS
jgi:hypothetical protein